MTCCHVKGQLNISALAVYLLPVPVLVLVTVTVTVVLSPELLPSKLFPAEGNTVVFLLLLSQSFQPPEFPYRHFPEKLFPSAAISRIISPASFGAD